MLQGLAGGSPGKLLTGLRVVDEQGRRAGIGRSLVRTLLWVVDGAPWIVPLVGFIVGLTATGHRRVGDMAAKTYVVARSDVGAPIQTSATIVPPGQQPWGAPPTSWQTPPAPAGSTWSPPTAPSAPPSAPPTTWSPPASAPEPDRDEPPAETPSPFVAPGAEPGAGTTPSSPPVASTADQPSSASPEPVPLPPPQWDQARNTYIQWEPNRQAWLQWDTAANRWKPIDT